MTDRDTPEQQAYRDGYAQGKADAEEEHEALGPGVGGVSKSNRKPRSNAQRRARGQKRRGRGGATGCHCGFLGFLKCCRCDGGTLLRGRCQNCGHKRGFVEVNGGI